MWLNRLVSLARSGGDRRPRDTIVSEIERRSKAIRDAEREAFRDLENADVVVPKGHYYDLGDKRLNLHPGVVLHRGLAHIDPALRV